VQEQIPDAEISTALPAVVEVASPRTRLYDRNTPSQLVTAG